MKSLLMCSVFFMIGCGHATTKMDRELALKLADKTPVIVTAPAPVINVNNYNGVPQSQSAEREVASQPVTNEHQKNCIYSPQYDANGNFLSTVRRCFGGQ